MATIFRFSFFLPLLSYATIIGAGILSLSAGQAKGTGWIPSIAISILLGSISGRTFVMVGEACDMLGEGDFKVRRGCVSWTNKMQCMHSNFPI